MFKKFLIGSSGVALAVASVPLFAAFEAHVINVTARIENALEVVTEPITFGTVFPQEHFVRDFFMTFSDSFRSSSQTRVTTAHYQIKQKPKPREAFVAQAGVTAARDFCHANLPSTPFGREDPAWQQYLQNCYPSLCPYLSKTPDGFPQPGNDVGVPAFHNPETPEGVARGKIKKASSDGVDQWVIDLAVPCFRGHCSQDWDAFVRQHNPAVTNPAAYQLPAELEHEVFGCDLWVEVTDIDNASATGVDAP